MHLMCCAAAAFDIIFEQQGANYMFLSTLTAVVWSRAPVVPPPFALLGLPCQICCFVVSRCCEWSPCSRSGYEVHTDDELHQPTIDVLSIAQLREKMEAHLEERRGDQGEDDFRWRSRLAKQQAEVGKQVADLTTQVAALAQQVAAVAAQLEDNGLRSRARSEASGLA